MLCHATAPVHGVKIRNFLATEKANFATPPSLSCRGRCLWRSLLCLGNCRDHGPTARHLHGRGHDPTSLRLGLAATGMRQPGCDNNTWICWPSVWIGLYRGNKSSDADGPGDEGPFIWSDNSPVDYTKWGTSRPYQDPKPTASSYASLYADPPDASKGYYVEKIVGKWDHSSGRWSSRAGVCKKGKPAQ